MTCHIEDERYGSGEIDGPEEFKRMIWEVFRQDAPPLRWQEGTAEDVAQGLLGVWVDSLGRTVLSQRLDP